MEALFDELIGEQRKKLLIFANKILPHLTEDDLLQPNDFPELEGHPLFRYEEGVLEGLLTARMAYLAKEKEGVAKLALRVKFDDFDADSVFCKST